MKIWWSDDLEMNVYIVKFVCNSLYKQAKIKLNLLTLFSSMFAYIEISISHRVFLIAVSNSSGNFWGTWCIRQLNFLSIIAELNSFEQGQGLWLSMCCLWEVLWKCHFWHMNKKVKCKAIIEKVWTLGNVKTFSCVVPPPPPKFNCLQYEEGNKEHFHIVAAMWPCWG